MTTEDTDDDYEEYEDEVGPRRPLVAKPGGYDGPVTKGAEHPTRKGWYATEFVDENGTPLWWKPPGRLFVWTRRIAMGVLILAGLVLVLIQVMLFLAERGIIQ